MGVASVWELETGAAANVFIRRYARLVRDSKMLVL